MSRIRADSVVLCAGLGNLKARTRNCRKMWVGAEMAYEFRGTVGPSQARRARCASLETSICAASGHDIIRSGGMQQFLAARRMAKRAV